MTRYELIRDFLGRMNDNSNVHYVKIDPVEGSSAPSVSTSNIVYEKEAYDVLLRGGFGISLVLKLNRFSDYGDHFLIDMYSGTIYKWGDREKGSSYGEVDKKIAKMILPIYKRYYLDEYADYFKKHKEDCFGRFVGVRDHFSVLAKGLKVLPWVCVGMVRNYK